MIDNIIFEDINGMMLNVNVTSTGELDNIVFDSIMDYYTLVAGGEIVYTF